MKSTGIVRKVDELGRIVREICSVEDGPRGHHDYRTYRWHR